MYDPARRRRGVRRGRERGCWVYVPGEVLHSAGLETRRSSPPPWYRIFPRGRRAVAVTFYEEA